MVVDRHTDHTWSIALAKDMMIFERLAPAGDPIAGKADAGWQQRKGADLPAGAGRANPDTPLRARFADPDLDRIAFRHYARRA